ncbi:epoxyqueuosine reductase [Bacteroidota bacterium]
MSLEKELTEKLKNKSADFVRYVDISHLSNKQNKQFASAILIGVALSPDFIQDLTNITDYVEKLRLNNLVKKDEFHIKESKMDKLADEIADYLISKGYPSYSQSENNIYTTGFFDENNKTTPLPHKTIALLAGLGWIGKHNLLVTPEFGSAICMCTVLTDAPLPTVLHTAPKSLCGDCTICEDICSVKALKGTPGKLESLEMK